MMQHANGTVPNASISESRDNPVQATDHAPSYVLVVDDEPAVRDFLTRCLEGQGYVVHAVASAAEALEMMVAKPALVVLCDIKMPGQDGLWLTERLHAHWPGTPVIMATAIDDLQTVRQSQKVGAVDYITKPIRPHQLLQVVGRAIRAGNEDDIISEAPRTSSQELETVHEKKVEAEYALECPARCPACGERVTTLKAVRLLRSQVNFTSTLPRRGRILACPHCLAVVPGELTNF